VEGITEVGFRRAHRGDFVDLQRWLSTHHVSEWWGEPPDLAGVETEYGPCLDGSDPTLLFVVTSGGRGVGMVQTYLLGDNPEYEAAVGVSDAAGIDLFIGEPDVLGQGLGAGTVRTFISEIGWNTYPRILRYMAGPSTRNVRSRRTFESAGFHFKALATVPGEPDQEAVMVLERPRDVPRREPK
jgi:aminoglycoside 6'-N-acetyltransferase